MAETTNIPDNLLSFLERSEGHTIISLYNSDDSSSKNNTLYNTIEILPKLNINNGLVATDFFDRQGNTISVTGTLKILNLNNQHLINMKIITK